MEMTDSMIDEEAHLAELLEPALSSIPMFESLFGLINLVMAGISGQLPSYCYFQSDEEVETWIGQNATSPGADARICKNIYLYLVDIALLDVKTTTFDYFRRNMISCLHEVVDTYGLP